MNSEVQTWELDNLAATVLEVCKARGWSLHWTHRGAYLHLEASELIEAVRGKRGTILGEAGDVLLVLMSITQNAGIPFSDVVAQAERTAEELKTKPHYAGEEYISDVCICAHDDWDCQNCVVCSNLNSSNLALDERQ